MIGLAEPYDAIARGLILTAVAVLWTVFLVRIVGLRAFSKMTAFDFVTTIATGSLIAQAGTRSEWVPFVQCLAAIGGVFLIQYLLATARQRSDAVQSFIANDPILLMENGEFCQRAMDQTRVARTTMIEKLRQANVSDLSKVRAVVLETTGNISVLHGDDFSDVLLEGVKRI